MIKLTVSKRFFVDIQGALTLDWVALTSSVVVIGIGLVYMVYGGEDGSINTMINNYGAGLDNAAANLVGVASNTPPQLE